MVEERNMVLCTFIAQVLRRTWEATWGLAGKAGSASTASGMSQEGEHLLGSTLCLIQGSHSMWLRPGQSCSSVLQSCKPHRKLFYVLETTRSELKKMYLRVQYSWVWLGRWRGNTFLLLKQWMGDDWLLWGWEGALEQYCSALDFFTHQVLDIKISS